MKVVSFILESSWAEIARQLQESLEWNTSDSVLKYDIYIPM